MNFILLVNIILIPAISVYISFLINKKQDNVVKIIFKYFTYISVHYVLTNILVRLVRYLIKTTITVEGLKYSIIALAIAIVLPFICKVVSLEYVKIKDKKNEDAKKIEENA